MKKIYFLTVGVLFSLSVFAGDILTGSEWTQSAFQDLAVGTFTPNENGGFQIAGDAGNQGIWKAVELTAGNIYALTGTYTTGGCADTWFQIHLASKSGAEIGEAGGEINGVNDPNNVFYFFNATTWNAGWPGSGDLAVSLDAGQYAGAGNTYTATASGTYYLIVKIGSMAHYDITVSTIAFDEEVGQQQGLNDLKADAFKMWSNDGTVEVEGVGNVAIYNVAGVLLDSGVSTSVFASKKLNAGIYIVTLNGIPQKIAVR
ncbi:MAG: hypothetical protein LBN95_08855 [Prevotellaceae bacterium]|jgi:hypothetical protein|nr:hypothetical protein [Prevotellaceae bacterium]